MKLTDLPMRPPKILLWGPAGCGKTLFTTSYGEGCQYIDCDDGLNSARTFKDKWTEERKKIDVIQCLEKDPSKANAWSDFRNLTLEITNQCHNGKYPYRFLVIDSFTRLAEYAKRMILNNSKAGIAGAMNKNTWGLAIEEIIRTFNYITALPIPVVCVFHDKTESKVTGKDDKGNDIEVEYKVVNIFGSNLPSYLVALFDECVNQRVRMVSGKPQPYITAVPDANTVLRTRANFADGFKTELGMREFLSQLGWTVK